MLGAMRIARCEIEGRGPLDVRLAAGRIAEIGPELEARPGEAVLDAAGGALLPGLHDHHIHLLALAAALRSVRCGPPDVCDEGGLAAALGAASRRQPGGFLRGVGYHDSVAGALDRRRLDAWVPDAPLRIQHRSGALWVLNSRAVDLVGLDRGVDAPGVERDAAGRATGRLLRLDDFLRAHLPPEPPPDLRPVGELLARGGVTGVTDATADNDPERLRVLARASREGALPQALFAMCGPAVSSGARHCEGVPILARKIVLEERALPDLDRLVADVAREHAGGRPVAVHCVTRAELFFALEAIGQAGPLPGDRIEHASVAPPEALARMGALGLTVVTQPGFVFERGDAYLRDVEPSDRPWLYRCRGLEEVGIPLGGGTDAPFGEAAPWGAMQSAVERRSRGGRMLGPAEGLAPERALALFTTPPAAPGGAPRRVEVGARADLCLLRVPWSRARERLSQGLVAATLRGGELLWSAPT